MQDARVQAWRKWGTLRDPALFERWFAQILVNTCRDQIVVVLLACSAMQRKLVGIPSRGYLLAETHERDAMGAALAMLSLDHRVVVALRFDRDLSVADIARYLGVPTGTVHLCLHHALKRLHALLDAPERKEGSQ